MTALPRVFAHRGASSLAPENTIAAFSKAMEVGARWFEFDVDIIADGTLIVIHDNRLDRTTNGKGGYYTHSFSDIRRLDAGAWFSDTYRFERIPEAADAISFGNKQHMGMNLEIKPCQGGTQLRERLIEALAVAVDSVLDKDRFIVSSSTTSFSQPSMRLVRRFRSLGSLTPRSSQLWAGKRARRLSAARRSTPMRRA